MKIKLCSFLPGLIPLESSPHTFPRLLLIQISKISQFCNLSFSQVRFCGCLSEAYWDLTLVTDLVAIRGSEWVGHEKYMRRDTKAFPFKATTAGWLPYQRGKTGPALSTGEGGRRAASAGKRS